MKKQNLLNVVFPIVFILTIVGCSTMVTIQSEPSGADIIINNQKMGKTPFTVKLSDFTFNSYDILLKKDGYEDYRGRVSKEAKAGPIIGSFFTYGISLLWCYGPQPYQTFYLAEKDKAIGAAVISKNPEILVTIDGKEIGTAPSQIPAGTHEIIMTKNDGSIVRKYAEFLEGNWYEFHL